MGPYDGSGGMTKDETPKEEKEEEEEEEDRARSESSLIGN